MTAMNLRFAFEKETKGAVRFQEVGEDGIQSAPHGSNNPRHTAKPAKIRYVKFFASKAPRRNHTA
jgi:hypothetical protein